MTVSGRRTRVVGNVVTDQREVSYRIRFELGAKNRPLVTELTEDEGGGSPDEPDFPARVFAFAALVFFIFAVAAAALTIDLGKTPDSQPISLEVSSTDANRIELPETIINAFSSSESMDVKIIGNSALVRTEDPAELIILTEKRRLSLLLVPEKMPSRTVIMRGGGAPSVRPGKKVGRNEAMEPLPYERAIMDLVISLASDPVATGKVLGKEVKLGIRFSSRASGRWPRPLSSLRSTW